MGRGDQEVGIYQVEDNHPHSLVGVFNEHCHPQCLIGEAMENPPLLTILMEDSIQDLGFLENHAGMQLFVELHQH
eukprot:15364777-Ditylum_brightwellii.AAC.2